MYLGRRLVKGSYIIGRLNVEATVPDLDGAMALRPRIEELCWRSMPGVLERVCDALLPQDLHLKLGRVELDLGTVRPNYIEEDTLAALEAAFSEMLSGALLSARRVPSEQARLLARSEAEMERLEAYLLGGVVSPVSRAVPFDPFTALLEAAEEQPEALIAMLRRRAHDHYVLERLVRQLGEEGLPRLLAVLAPADSAVILGLLLDVALVHRRTKLPELEHVTETALRELTWIATLEFLLRDAGSQFNRRRFLRFLIEREARGVGIAYEALLGLLAAAAEKAARRSLLNASLPRTLAELLAESADAAVPPLSQAPSDETMEALVLLARRHARALPHLRALFAFTSGDTLDALLRRLDPTSVVSIQEDFRELEALQVTMPVLPSTGEDFRRMIRIAALAYVATPGRGGFRRRSFWRSVIAGLSRQAGFSAVELADMLRRSLVGLAGRYPRLTALMGDLAGFALPSPPVDFAAGTIEEAVARAIRAESPAGPALERLLDGADSVVLRRLVERLSKDDANGIFAVVARLTGGRVDATSAQLERRSLTIAAVHLAELGDRPFDLRDWSRRLLRDLRVDGEAARDEAIELFLRTGRPRRAGADLHRLAARDPAGLAGRLTRFARQSPEAVSALAGRLLDWLTPRDLLALLAPELAVSGEALALGGERAALLPVVEALLRGAPLPGGGGQDAKASLDRYALTAHWLAQGRLPAWAPAGAGPKDLAAGLAELDLVILVALLPHEPAGIAVGRAHLLAWLESGRDGEEADMARHFLSLAERNDSVLRGYLAARRFQPGVRDRLAALLARVEAPPEIEAMLPETTLEKPPRKETVPDDNGAALFAWLSGSGREDGEEMVRRLLSMVDRDDSLLRDYLAAHRSRPEMRRRWAAVLPPEGLARLVGLLTPPGTRGLVEGGILIGAAWRQLAPFGARRFEPAALWSELLDRIATPGPVDLGHVLSSLIDGLAGGDTARRATLTGRVRRLARDGGHVSVRLALRPARETPRPVPSPAARKASKPAASASSRLPAAPDQAILIGNAGLALLNPFLPTLFERLGLWPGATPERLRRDGIEDASRAVHLLQYLVDGRLDAPEAELVLNKVMCGKPAAYPVARSLSPDPADLRLCDDLIGAVLENWPPLRGSSPAALRETFLQREGSLRHADGKWQLRVQRKTVDVLLGQVPWGFGIIYHGWMQDPLHATW